MTRDAHHPHPYAVRPHDNGWAVWVFDGSSPIEIHGRKQDAINSATDLAHSVNRPGVVVFNGDGGFQRFISNDRYWEVKTRGMRW